MSEFNPDDYFARRAAPVRPSLGEASLSKRQALDEAHARKMEALDIHQAKRAAVAESWVGKTGMETNGAGKYIVNQAASVVSGAARGAGNIATAPMDLAAMGAEAGVDQATLDAFGRYQQDQATPEDMALLQRPTVVPEQTDRLGAIGPQVFNIDGREVILPTRDDAGNTLPEADVIAEFQRTGRALPASMDPRNGPTYPSAAQEVDASGQAAPTYLDQLTMAAGARETADTVNAKMDVSSIIHQGNREALSEDLATGSQEGLAQLNQAIEKWGQGERLSSVVDGVTALGKLAATAGDSMLENPVAFQEYAAEMLPDLALGAVSKPLLGIRNIGYGIQAYREGLANYQAENDGAYPPEDVRNWMLLNAFGSAAAEQVADGTLLKLVKKTPPVKPKVSKAPEAEPSKSALVRGVKAVANSGVAKAAGNITKAGAKGTLAEGATEGAQTAMEGEARLEPATGTEIFEGATIGAGAGGGIAATGRTVAEATGNTPQKREKRAEIVQEKVDQQAQFEAAAESGDVSAYLKPKSYAPEKAIGALALRVQRKNLTGEDLEAVKKQAKQIINDLDTQVEAKELELQQLNPENQAEAKAEAQLAELKADQAKEPTEERASDIAMVEKILEEIKAITPKKLKSMKVALATQQNKLKAAKDLADFLAAESRDDAKIDELIKQVNEPVQAREVIDLAMEDPEALSPEALETVISDTENGLSLKQRNYLRSFSKARMAYNELQSREGVTQDITQGNDRFKSIKDYKDRLHLALKNNRRKTADDQMAGIQQFAEHHRTKVQAMREGLAIANDPKNTKGLGAQVVYRNATGWEVRPLTAPRIKSKDLQRNGGFTVIPGSESTIETAEAEANLLKATYEEMKAAYDLGFAEDTTAAPEAKPAPKAAPTPKQVTPEAKQPAEATTEAQTTPAPKQTESPAKKGTFDNRINDLRKGVRDLRVVGKELEESGEDIFVIPEGRERMAGMLRKPLVALTTLAQQPNTAPVTDVLNDAFESLLGHGKTAKDAEAVLAEATDDFTLGKSLNFADIDTIENTFTALGKLLVEQEKATPDLFTDAVTEPTPAPKVEKPVEPEPVVQEVAPEVQEEAAPSEGQLDVLQEKIPEGLSPAKFHEANLVAEEFTQTPVDEKNQTNRPLVAMKNFLSALDANLALANDFVLEPINDAQRKLLAHYVMQVKKWNQELQANLKPKAKEHRHTDYMQFFMDETGQTEENVLTAISSAAFTWLAETGNEEVLNSDAQINTILGRSKENELIPTERAFFQPVGNRAPAVMNALGKRAAQALGLKANKDADLAAQSRLESALGMQALSLLLRSGAVERHGVIHPVLDREGNTSPGEKHPFIRLIPESKVGSLAAIYSQGTQGVLDSMLSVEGGLRYPSFEPVPHTQKFTNNTRRPGPTELKETLDDEGAKPHQVRKDMQDAYEELTPDIRDRIAGIVDTKKRRIHAFNKVGVQGKNDALTRAMRHWDEFIGMVEAQEKGLDQAVYFGRNIWRMHRVGIDSNFINPQDTKMHRPMLSMKEWETEVSLDDPEMLETFKVAVAAALGIKTDNLRNDKVLEALDKRLEKPAYRRAIKALEKKIHTGQVMNAGDQEAIAQAVEHAGEGFHSLDGLVNLAHLSWAMRPENKLTSFKTQMMHEVDGRTNGPMITQFMLGAAHSMEGLFRMLNRGGFYEQGSPYRNSYDWRNSPGSRDLYEMLAESLDRMIQTDRRKTPENQAAYDALFFLTGAFMDTNTVPPKGRKAVKKLITSMFFGSGIPNAVDTKADELLQAAYDKIEEAVNANDATTVKEGLQHINALITRGERPDLQVNADMTPDQALDYVLSDDQVKAFKKGFADTTGKLVKKIMYRDHGLFMNRRNTLTQATEIAFSLYNALYNQKREALINHLVAQGEMPLTGKGKFGTRKQKARRDLTQAQENQLRKALKSMEPVMHTPFSQMRNERKAGIYMAKELRKSSTYLPYTGETVFANKVPSNSKTDKPINHYDLRGVRFTEVSAGVAPMILSTHSVDSAIAAFTYKRFHALNVHDALGFGLKDVKEGSQALNKNTFEVIRDFSTPQEMVGTLERTLLGLHKQIQSGGVSPELSAAYEELQQEVYRKITKKPGAEEMFEERGIDPISYALESAHQAALSADILKLDALSQMAVVDQYAYQGGAYEVTDADRASALALRNALIDKASKPSPAFEAAQALNERMAQERGEHARQEERKRLSERDKKFAARLKAWLSEARNKLHQRQQAGEPRTPKETESLEILERISQVYQNTGSLNTALERVVKDEAERAKWLKRIKKETHKYDPEVTGIETAPEAIVMELLDRGSQDEDLSEDVRANLTRVLETMYEDGEGLREALLKEGLDEVTTDQVLGYLNRHYNGTRMTAWGEIGVPARGSNPDLVAFFEANPNTNAKAVIQQLKQLIKARAPSKTRSFYAQLLSRIEQGVNPDLPIRYVTGNTPADILPTGGITKARGTYNSTEAGESITFKSPDFVDSAITVETVLHELTHGTLAQITEKPTAETKPLVQELETLRALADKRIKADKALHKYANATKNVHELIAWGMSNTGFQEEVLGKIEMQSQTTSNRLVTGMKKFIDTLTGIFFRKQTRPEHTSGMEVLIGNVSGLFQAVTEHKADRSNLSLQHSDAAAGFTTTQIYEALGTQPDADYDAHLRQVMKGIVDKIHGPFGAYLREARQSAPVTPQDVFVNSLVSGRSPFASQTLAAQLSLSDQEAFLLEQVEVTVQASLNSSTVAYQEVQKLYREARQQLKNQNVPGYDYIFNAEAKADGTSDYLSRFMALGLTYKPLHDAMAQVTTPPRPNLKSLRLVDQVKEVFDRLLNLINGKLTNTYEGQAGHARLQTLAEQLVSIENKKRVHLTRKQTGLSQALERTSKTIADKARETVVKVGRSGFFRRSKNGYVRAVGSVSSAIASDQAHFILQAWEDLRNQQFQARMGVIMGTVKEVQGANDSNVTAYELLREANRQQQERKLHIDQTRKLVRESFANNGEDLSDDDLKALTRIGLRTDLASLLATHSMADIADLVQSDRKLQAAIDAQVQKLQGPHRHYYLKSAKQLGYFLATGHNRSPNLMLNAYNIAHLGNTQYTGQVTEAQADAAIAVLDPLITLYALKHSDKQDLKLFQQVLATEQKRKGKQNGVEMILRLHKGLQDQAMETLFENNPVHFMKGYTKDTYNPYKEVKIASGAQGANLARMGWSKSPNPLPNDPADPDQSTKYIYSVRDGGLSAHVTGVFSYTGKHERGTTAHQGVMNVHYDTPNQKAINTNNQIAAKKAAAIDAMFQADANYDPSVSKEVHMAPILNHAGDAANYRHMMSEAVKDTLLERNNQIDHVLGTMAGSVYDKATTESQNAVAVKALYDQYQEEFVLKPESFITVGPNSKDPELQEIYRLLPDETKKEIKKVWGKNEMQVRVDLLDINFGYRKYSLSGIFKKAEDQKNAVEQAFDAVVSFFLGDKAALRVRQAEDVWQELVKEVKDFWVIKAIDTLLGNLTSNISELIWMGVPVTDIGKNTRIALKSALAYQNDRKELLDLQRLVQITYVQGNLADIQQRIIELEDSLKRNPVHEMFEAGLFQTIVEDVDLQDDDFTYKSWLARKTDKVTGKVPKPIKTVGRWAYMAHDTPLYKLMYQGTHLSDFVARYVLHQHMINRKKNPLSKRESFKLASEAFVNYDIPTHKSLQYLNDMGLVWFTKYYLRIQKVLMFLYRDNPGRSLAIILFGNFFDGISTLAESSVFARLGNNPISTGAFELPGALDEGLMTQMAMSPFNN